LDARSNDVLDTAEAATFLRLNEQTVRRLARDREIPAFKVGGVWRFRRSQLERWAAAQQPPEPRPGRILVVDDEASVREVIEQLLSAAGYEVVVAANGHEALALMPRVRADIVLLDLAMPGLDGPDTLRLLRAGWQDVPVVVLTGYPDSGLLSRALNYSPFTLLAKPFRPERLVETIRLIRRQQAGAENAAGSPPPPGEAS